MNYIVYNLIDILFLILLKFIEYSIYSIFEGNLPIKFSRIFYLWSDDPFFLKKSQKINFTNIYIFHSYKNFLYSI